MKKNLLIISVCALTFFFSSPAYSAEGPYVSGNIGFAMLTHLFDQKNKSYILQHVTFFKPSLWHYFCL